VFQAGTIDVAGFAKYVARPAVTSDSSMPAELPSQASIRRALDDLTARVASGSGRILALGLGGPLLAAAAAEVAAILPGAERPLVVVMPDEDQAAELARDLELFLPASAGADDPAAPPRALLLPAVETSPYAELTPDRRAIMLRQATLFRLSQGLSGEVVVVSPRALMRRVMPRAAFGALCEVVVADSDIDRDALATQLGRAGFARVPIVEDPGTFAVRGGVIDVFAPLYRYPTRIELFGDTVESIRFFDPRTQRTLRTLGELYLHPVRETVKSAGQRLRERVLAAADAATHPSSKTRVLLEQLERGEEFFGIEALTPAFHTHMTSIAEYLPQRAHYLVVDPEGVRRAVAKELEDAEARFTARRAEQKVALGPGEHFLSPDEVGGLLARAPVLIEVRAVELLSADPVPTVRFAADENRELAAELARARAEKADELLAPLVREIERAQAARERTVMVSAGRAGAERLRALLASYDLEASISDNPGGRALWRLPGGGAPVILIGTLGRGFFARADGLRVIAEEEIFGPRSHVRRAADKPTKGRVFGADATDFAELKPGDYLVHRVNGVGLYKGLAKLPMKGTPIDFLHIEYDGGALYLPVYRLNEVQRYVGGDTAKPRLDRLGGVTWEKTRRKVSAEVKKMAEELLQLYAQRQALPGHAFPEPDTVFREFEATFPFEETPDQQKAIDDVLADLQKPQPMDRLVCGDVGYGKTEVALRAAMHVALAGKQVAVLAPTTVLVEQHAQNFAARMGGWPVKVAGLSRFTPKPAQTRIVRELAEGQLDVVVGTHRLLSNDVRFKDLGLIVIDEEQRFGVAHKEKLKKLRTQVDVLTLTATPIPRSLNLALVGAREMSIIATPPVDRLAIRTLVSRPADDVITEGVKKELGRGGQVFFVVPRIGVPGQPLSPDEVPTIDSELDGAERRRTTRGERSLADWVEHLGELVPGARVAGAHGQMPPEALEKVMVDFVAGRYDILVSTTIIEAGLDIPRANTMFVDHAEYFGLAQLYQLRGRIGRAKERAYCYLMVPPLEALTPEAKQRLATLQRFTELGAGFMVASHDLEIRGAGDLLGAQQHGHIAAVGFETYARILEEAVAELRGAPIRPERDPELNVDLPGFIPDDYVPDTGQRLDLYKRLSGADNDDDVNAILEEMHDRYGDVPDEAKLLGELMLVKAAGRRLGAVTIDLTAERLSLALDSQATPLKPEKVLALVNRKKSPFRLTPDMRLQKTFDESERKDRVRAALRALLELTECAN
jgi:transcription-repair coupling factor (superfamily II helicase)